MGRPTTYSPGRRMLMQGIMWAILGATVGLAALVTYHRRSSFEVKLADPTSFRGVTVQLPKGWQITKGSDDLSGVLLTATEKMSKNQSDDEDDESGARVVRIVRQPIVSNRTPLEYALSRLHTDGQMTKTARGEDYIPIAGSPGEVIYQNRVVAPRSLQDALQGGMRQVKTIVAATVGASGRGLAIEMDGDGEVGAMDIDLIKRIAATVKCADEPALLDSGEATLDNGIRVPIPADFAAVKDDDPLSVSGRLRIRKNTGPMSDIFLLPVVMSDKDGAATFQTMLSVYGGGFEDTSAQAEPTGGFRADGDPGLRRWVPLRAYSIAKAGRGALVIFRGGEDDSWIDDAWNSMHDKVVFPDDSDIDQLITDGSTAAKRVMDGGVATLLPQITDDLWWKLCINDQEHALGWVKYTPSTNAGRFEGRWQVENEFVELSYDWRGPLDLKSYRVKTTDAVSDIRDKEAPQKDVDDFVASYKAGKVDFTPKSATKPITYTAPANYIPGGWLQLAMPKIVDRPMVLRTDSFMDYATAQPRDFLTITLRPEPDAARPTDDTQTKMRCISVQVSGAPEKTRWFFREDGTLDGIDYPDAQHLIRSDEHDVTQEFAHKEALRP